MNVPYPAGSPGADMPLTHLFEITPSDTEDLAVCPRCLILSEAGTVTVDMLGSGTAVAVPLQAGFNPIRPRRVYASGTDSGLILVGGY